MPNISELNVGPLDIRPGETGVEAAAQAGRRLGAYGSQIAQSKMQTGEVVGRGLKEAGDAAVDYMAHREISMGAANGAKMIASLNQDWNNLAKNADPNDPTLATKWREQSLEPRLQQFHDSFLTEGGQQWAEHFVDQYRQHAVVKTAADMSSLAADAVHVNALKTVNGLSTAAFNDPSTIDFARGALAHSLDGLTGSSPNISAADASKVKMELTQAGEEKIVKSAIMGAIVKGGNWQSIANDPKNAPYVNATEIQQFARAEKMYQRMAQAEDRQARVMQDYTAKKDFNGAADQLELATLPQKAGDKPVLPQDYWDSVRKLGSMPGAALEPGRLKTMVDNGERLTAQLGKPEPLSGISHATTMDLLGKMRSVGPDRMTDNTPIYKAYGDGKLNNADFNFLMNNFQQAKTPEGERLDKDRDLFFKRYQLSFDPEMGMSKGGRQPLYEAEMAAREQEASLRAKGLDPHLVYDPRSEYFFGNPANIQKWRTSAPLQTQMYQVPQAEANKPPARPDGFPSDAQWDTARKIWYVTRDGKKMQVNPIAAPKPYKLPMSQ